MISIKHDKSSMKYRTVLALFGFIGASIILYSTSRYGVGLPNDGVLYIVVARHIADGNGVTFNDSPVVLHPPLYSVILSVLDYSLGIDPLSSAPIVNAILFGIIVYFSGMLFNKFVSSSYIPSLILIFFLLVTSPLYEVALIAWSEPLFICLVLIYLFGCQQYAVKEDWNSILLMSLSTSLACLTRYIGIILIPMGMAHILLISAAKQMKARGRHLIIYLLIAVVPIGLWILRNFLLSDTWFGRRHPSQFSLAENINFTVDTILSWYIPNQIVGAPEIRLYLGIITGILLAINIRKKSQETQTVLNQISPALLFVTVYVSSLIISSTLIAYDQINNRLLSPAFVPLTMLGVYYFTKVFQSTKSRFRRTPVDTILLILLIIGAGAYQAHATFSIISNHYATGGYGYNNKFWQESDTIQYLLSQPTLASNCTIYSNVPMALQMVDIRAHWLPARRAHNSTKLLDQISDLRGVWPQEDRICLVWFTREFIYRIFDLEEFQTITIMEIIVRLSDGEIYMVRKR